MNIFDTLKKYAEKKKQKNTIKNSRGVYINDYTSRTYSTIVKDAASLIDDAYE